MAKSKKLSKSAQKTLEMMKARAAKQKKKPARSKPIARPKMAKQEAPKAPVRKSLYSKQELEFFRSIILEKKKELLEDIETTHTSLVDPQTGEYVSENSTYSTHMEQGTDAMEREKMFLFASREVKYLNHLDDALKRIDKGIYGRCTECEKLIEKERLEAVPHAQQCLQCKLRKSK